MNSKVIIRAIVAMLVVSYAAATGPCRPLFPAYVYERLFTSIDSNGNSFVNAQEVIVYLAKTGFTPDAVKVQAAID